MNDILNNIRLAMAILIVAGIYVVVVQVVNDASCRALAESSQPSFAKSVLQLITLC